VVTPGIVTQFREGALSAKGVTCVSCHGADHDVINENGGHVKASTCAGCHPRQDAEFTAKDATNAIVEKHALGWTRMTASARYIVMPQAERATMCGRCHNIGKVWSDGSIGKCDSCHTRHVFSEEEALEPEACGTCHMGPDHEQIDMWEKSKHGVVYTTEKGRPGGDPSRAPTCVTCHMPDIENGAGQPLVHNLSTNITLGTVAQGAELTGTALPVPMRTISQVDFAARRQKMLIVCGRCHAQQGFAAAQLADADQVKRDIDAKLWDPVMRIRGLWYDGLLDPMPVHRPPNPAYPTVNGGLVLVLGGQQLYGGTSAIEQLFFQTYKYDHVSTFKGAYHVNPDYSHWYGWARVNPDIDLIRGEEARLRRAESPYDPGFIVTPAKPTVGGATTFDASGLLAWGDPSPNTFTWQFGDAYVAGGSGGDVVTHTYKVPGRFTVRLTVSDTDVVNDAANPTNCSALRTTAAKVSVKYRSRGEIPSIARVKKGATTTVKVRVWSAANGTGSIRLQRKSGSGTWSVLQTRGNVGVAAGLWTTCSFKVTLNGTSSFRAVWSGSATIWGALTNARSVKPL
jgi:hydroxylamine dehydrogenase